MSAAASAVTSATTPTRYLDAEGDRGHRER
jgi:hypothetical protein